METSAADRAPNQAFAAASALMLYPDDDPVQLAFQPRSDAEAPATGTLRPSMYNCRVSLAAGTGADQTPLVPSCTQPVTRVAPEITGKAPGAARHITGCPALPESAAVNFQVLDNR
ncbi:hypothetical protein Rhe02_52880 [Rhizocola hellebori]|uniref:Uncharacterized protein n=1 Tax=Rhizocola hellebori TaxID=1392758 RepID=A0A8J3QD70_9ACTN|nr:hypothetical protein Rhe02_52880 [Rhizocola hellebori]